MFLSLSFCFYFIFFFFLAVFHLSGKQNEKFIKYYGIGIYYRNKNLHNYRSYWRIMVQDGMLGDQGEGTDQPYWSTGVADTSELVRELEVGPGWSPGGAAYGNATVSTSAGGLAFPWEKTAGHGTRKNKGYFRSTGTSVSLLLNTMTFRVHWLLLLRIPSPAQISILFSFNLEPHRKGNSEDIVVA